MQQLSQFVMNHWILWSIFLAVLIALVIEEVKGRMNAAPSLNPQEVSMLLNHEEATVIDIRSTALFHKEHILSALNIPTTTSKNIDELLKRLSPKKDQHIVLVDSMGTDSNQIALQLYSSGFTKVSVLRGGINTWRREGLPVVNK